MKVGMITAVRIPRRSRLASRRKLASLRVIRQRRRLRLVKGGEITLLTR